MKNILIGLAAATVITGMASAAMAQDTVMHQESADGMHSKTVVAHANGAKTIVKRGVHHVKKVHIEPNGDKTVVKKTTD